MALIPATGFLKAGDGTRLFWRRWRSAALSGGEGPAAAAAVPPDGAGAGAPPIVLVHGAFEDTSRYQHVAEFFSRHGHSVWAMDHRGHGRSDGPRMFVRRFREYLDDLSAFVARVTAEEGSRPVMVAHSMGGLVAARWSLDHQERIRALVLSSPWIQNRVPVPVHMQVLAVLADHLCPGLVLRRPKGEPVYRDMSVAKREVESDHTVITPRWFREGLRTQQTVLRRANELTLPLLVMQAGEDVLAHPAGARALFDRAGSADKAWKLYEGRYHEIFNDLGWREVLADLLAWLAERGLAPVTAPTRPAER